MLQCFWGKSRENNKQNVNQKNKRLRKIRKTQNKIICRLQEKNFDEHQKFQLFHFNWLNVVSIAFLTIFDNAL
jgi:hypothetical protein